MPHLALSFHGCHWGIHQHSTLQAPSNPPANYTLVQEMIHQELQNRAHNRAD